MKGPVDISPVKYIYKSGMVGIYTVIVKDVHPAQSMYETIAIVNEYVANLGHPPKMIIKNRDILYLDHGTKVIVLYKGIVVKSRIERDVGPTQINLGAHIDPIVNVKIKFTIWIYGKGNPAFHKNEGIVEPIGAACRNIIFIAYS